MEVEVDEDHLSPGHYYEVVLEGAHVWRSVIGRYRGKLRLRGVVHWWFTGDAFQILVDPDDVKKLYYHGRMYGKRP